MFDNISATSCLERLFDEMSSAVCAECRNQRGLETAVLVSASVSWSTGLWSCGLRSITCTRYDLRKFFLLNRVVNTVCLIMLCGWIF